jgi:hypothetical protein
MWPCKDAPLVKRPVASRIAWTALALLLVGTAVLVFYETRDTTLWFDEWPWALDRRGGGLETLLEPHNQHLSLVPVLIYKALFATAGLDDYAPYRICIIAAHLACCALVFVYARRRIGSLPALVPTAVLLLLGPAWQNILWPFQVGSVISLAAGVGALLVLDRGDRIGDAGACALLGLSIASSGNGLPIAIGVAVEVLLVRRRPRDVWIIAGPVALYGIWWLGYQDATFARHNIVVAPRFAADAAAGALAALTGLSGPQVNGSADTVGWGRPLALAAAALLIWRMARRPVPGRALTLLAILLSFWLLTALQRAQFGAPDSGRYLYYGALFIVLLAVELTRGIDISCAGGLLIAGAALFAVTANLGDLRDGARYLTVQADATRADLGAIEIGRGSVPPGYVASRLPGYPLVMLRADRYLATAAALGSPAASPAEIGSLPEEARAAADGELVGIDDVALRPGPVRAGASAPTVDEVSGGITSTSGACISFRPAGARTGDAVPELELTLPAAGVGLTAARGPAAVSVRRFAVTFPPAPLATLALGGSAILRIGGDRAPEPWHVRIAPQGHITACGL